MNNREWASLFWLAVVVIFMVVDADRRSSVAGVLRAAMQRKVLLTFVAFGSWVWLEVQVGARVGWWSPALLKDTFIWTATAGVALLFGFDKALKEGAFFRRAGTAAIKATLFVEAFINLYVLPLLFELVLQPVLVLLVGFGIVARKEQEAAKRVAESLHSVIGFALFGFVFMQSLQNWRELEASLLVRQLALPVWLTFGLLPFVYAVALFAAYESAFMRIDWKADVPGRQRFLAKAALVLKFHVKARELSTFSGPWQFRVRDATTIGAAFSVIQQFRAAKRAERDEAVAAAIRLEQYAGVTGTDEDGRRLDRREFDETKDALRWLATCMMGWYRHNDHYVDDLLERFQDDFSSHGLPQPSGIKLRVSDDGQSWYAWRKTITGWVFAIGATGPPPDQWEYDRPEPPIQLPGEGGPWVSSLTLATDATTNWN